MATWAVQSMMVKTQESGQSDVVYLVDWLASDALDDPVPPFAIGAVESVASEPRPRAVLASGAFAAPVPPLATGSVPVTWDDSETLESVASAPSPRLDRAAAASFNSSRFPDPLSGSSNDFANGNSVEMMPEKLLFPYLGIPLFCITPHRHRRRCLGLRSGWLHPTRGRPRHCWRCS